MRENFKTPALALLLSSVVMSGAFAMDLEDRDDREVAPGTLTLNTPGITNNDGTLTLPNGLTVTFLNGGTLTLTTGSRNQPSTAAR